MRRTLCVVAALATFVACGEEPPPSRAHNRPSTATTPSDDEDLSYTCGGAAFPATALEDRQPLSDDLLAAIEKLRKSPEGDIVPPDGWFVVAETPERATLLAPRGDEFSSATFEQEREGWDVATWGDCLPRLHLPGRSVLRWAFTEDAYPPDPGATELEVLAVESQCSSGRDIEDLIDASVEYGEDRVEVVLTAPGLKGGFGYTCQGTPPTEYELVLSEPVGDRKVVDLSVYPPVEPDPGTRLP